MLNIFFLTYYLISICISSPVCPEPNSDNEWAHCAEYDDPCKDEEMAKGTLWLIALGPGTDEKSPWTLNFVLKYPVDDYADVHCSGTKDDKYGLGAFSNSLSDYICCKRKIDFSVATALQFDPHDSSFSEHKSHAAMLTLPDNYPSNISVGMGEYACMGHSIYRPFEGKIKATDTFFGGPCYWQATNKRFAQVSTSIKAVPKILRDFPKDKWKTCSNDGFTCDDLETGAAIYMRYGKEPVWVYRLIYANGNSVNCDKYMFGYASEVSLNADECICQIGPAVYSITKIFSYWHFVGSVTNGNPTQTTKHGVTRVTTTSTTSSQEYSTTWSDSFSVGFEFGRENGAKISSSNDFSKSTTETTTNSVTTELSREDMTEEDFETKCDKMDTGVTAVWQYYVTAMEDNGINQGLTIIKTQQFVCTNDNTQQPKCPPGAIDPNDDSGQTCKDQESATKADL